MMKWPLHIRKRYLNVNVMKFLHKIYLLYYCYLKLSGSRFAREELLLRSLPRALSRVSPSTSLYWGIIAYITSNHNLCRQHVPVARQYTITPTNQLRNILFQIHLLSLILLRRALYFQTSYSTLVHELR